MKKKLGAILVIVILLVCMVLAGCQSTSSVSDEVQPDEERVIRLAHVVNERDGFHIAAVKFKELVEEQTDGKVKIDIFPNASLGDERTLLEGMQMGTLEMGVITNGPIANFVPEIAVFELPFLFDSREQVYNVLDGPVGQEVLDTLSKADLKGLAFAERGFRNLTNSKRPVTKAADVEGLKIRVMENPVYIDTFKALGANAVPMAWTETLTALQQGTIDGQENPIVVIHSYKINETQKYLSLTRHTYAPATIIMSQEVFDSFPADIQETIIACAQEAARYERKWNEDQEDTQVQELRDLGMEISEVDVESFRNAVEPVYDKYEKQYGQLLAKITQQL